MARNPWRRSDLLTSSGGAGTTPTAIRYRRLNKAGGIRLGAGASPGPAAGQATPGMTPPTGTGLVPAGPPCSPEWSPDPGATSTDPDDDILTLDRDALLLPLALDRDALPLDQLPPPRPDLLQGTRWGLGMMGLVLGPTGIRCAPVEQDKGGDARADSPSPGRGPSSSLSYPGRPATQARRSSSSSPRTTHTRGAGRPRDRDGRQTGTHATPRDPRDTEGS